jgi:hypothetical protein
MKLEEVRDKSRGIIFSARNFPLMVKNNDEMATKQAEMLATHIEIFWLNSDGVIDALGFGELMLGFAESCFMSGYITAGTLFNILKLKEEVMDYHTKRIRNEED